MNREIEFMAIDQPKIEGKKEKGMTLGLMPSHLMLKYEEITIIMKVERSQSSTKDILEKALKTILEETKIEEIRRSGEYQNIIKEF
jgi:hypothetical protein